MAVPFLDLKAQYLQIRDEVRPEFDEIMETCYYVLGPKVKNFEEKFAELCGVKHCIALSSGTAAVHGMIWASELPAGSGLITPPNTFTATAEGIILAGHVPVFADADPVTWNLSPEKVEELLKASMKNGKPVDSRTGAVIRGIVAVDLYGQAADYEALEAIAEQYGLHLFEDAAQSHDGSRAGRSTGSFGNAASFSFYPGKNMGAWGEGGAVTTNDDRLAAKMRSLRDHGSSQKYYYDCIGHNYRMSAFQGAVLGIKTGYIHNWNNGRIEAAGRYEKLLAKTPLELPQVAPETRHVFHLYAVHTPERKRLREFLEERKIGAGLHYPEPLHTQKAYAHLGYSKGDFPVCEKNAAENMTLPMFPELGNEQQKEVAGAIEDFFRKG
ncbi:erythromycin biosynthesis sensory transduction protein eryC1 [Candidatus Fermentibacteria bacterium]|nr:MAG: erythromycin biosynthesis sensory transduction protein eryC1 [Candidatus Fermentibacteria bacterium]